MEGIMTIVFHSPTDPDLTTYDFGTKIREALARLPSRLHMRVKNALLLLKEKKIETVKYEQGRILIMLDGVYCPINSTGKFSFNRETVKIISEAISLMHWYLRPRFYYIPKSKVSEAKLCCVDCDWLHVLTNNFRCMNQRCPSREKISKIYKGEEPKDN